jgi:hypothetical protein
LAGIKGPLSIIALSGRVLSAGTASPWVDIIVEEADCDPPYSVRSARLGSAIGIPDRFCPIVTMLGFEREIV